MASVSSLRIPKYRHHKPSGRAVVRIQGHDHYLGRYGSKASKVEYERIIKEYLVRGGVSIQTSQMEITIAEVLVAYLRYAKT